MLTVLPLRTLEQVRTLTAPEAPQLYSWAGAEPDPPEMPLFAPKSMVIVLSERMLLQVRSWVRKIVSTVIS